MRVGELFKKDPELSEKMEGFKNLEVKDLTEGDLRKILSSGIESSMKEEVYLSMILMAHGSDMEKTVKETLSLVSGKVGKDFAAAHIWYGLDSLSFMNVHDGFDPRLLTKLLTMEMDDDLAVGFLNQEIKALHTSKELSMRDWFIHGMLDAGIDVTIYDDEGNRPLRNLMMAGESHQIWNESKKRCLEDAFVRMAEMGNGMADLEKEVVPILKQAERSGFFNHIKALTEKEELSKDSSDGKERPRRRC